MNETPPLRADDSWARFTVLTIPYPLPAIPNVSVWPISLRLRVCQQLRDLYRGGWVREPWMRNIPQGAVDQAIREDPDLRLNLHDWKVVQSQ